MSIQRRIIERLNESRKLDEAWAPVLNSLAPYEKTKVRTALIKQGIDIENTPYQATVITNSRDPRLKGKNVCIFEFQESGRPQLAVWFNGEFIVDYYSYKAQKNVSRMSWRDILEYSTRITTMEFDQKSADALVAKRNERYALKKSIPQGTIRYTPKNRPKYVTLDKSGYIIDPSKYQKMLSALKINDGAKVLQDAKTVYTKLANNLDKIDWDSDNDYYNYDTIMKLIVREFQDLTKNLKKYEDYKQKNPDAENNPDSKWWIDSLKDQVASSIRNMRELMVKAKKYL